MVKELFSILRLIFTLILCINIIETRFNSKTAKIFTKENSPSFGQEVAFYAGGKVLISEPWVESGFVHQYNIQDMEFEKSFTSQGVKSIGATIARDAGAENFAIFFPFTTSTSTAILVKRKGNNQLEVVSAPTTNVLYTNDIKLRGFDAILDTQRTGLIMVIGNPASYGHLGDIYGARYDNGGLQFETESPSIENTFRLGFKLKYVDLFNSGKKDLIYPTLEYKSEECLELNKRDGNKYKKYHSICNKNVGTGFGYSFDIMTYGSLRTRLLKQKIIAIGIPFDYKKGINAGALKIVSVIRKPDLTIGTTSIITMRGDPYSLMGFNVKSIGDIDNNGYEDLIVAAPFYKNVGALYIIYQSVEGFDQNNRYIMTKEEFTGLNMDYIGFKIDSFDTNEDYKNEIIIGGRGSAIYMEPMQSKSISGEFSAGPTQENISIPKDTINHDLDRKVYSQYGTNLKLCLTNKVERSVEEIKIKYQMTYASKKNPQGTFMDKSLQVNGEFTISGQKEACVEQQFILFKYHDENSRLKFKANFNLSDSNSYNSLLYENKFELDIGIFVDYTKVPNLPDLTLTSESEDATKPTNMKIEQGGIINIPLTVSNKYKTATNVHMNVVFDDDLSLVSVSNLLKVTETNGPSGKNSIRIDIEDKFLWDTKVSFSMKLAVGTIQEPKKTYSVSMTVANDEGDYKPSDNILNLDYLLNIESTVDLSGFMNPDLISLIENDKDMVMNKVDNVGANFYVELKNLNGLVIKESVISIRIPAIYKGKRMLTLVDERYLKSTENSKILPCTDLNKNNGEYMLTKEEVESLKIKDCDEIDSIECLEYKCSIPNVMIDKPIAFMIKMYLKRDQLFELMDVNIFTNFTLTFPTKVESPIIKDEDEQPIKHNLLGTTNFKSTINVGKVVEAETLTSIPIWIFVVAGLSAVLILSIIVFTLYKVGFFKRKRMEANNDGDD